VEQGKEDNKKNKMAMNYKKRGVDEDKNGVILCQFRFCVVHQTTAPHKKTST
jgi:hypothetical protein